MIVTSKTDLAGIGSDIGHDGVEVVTGGIKRHSICNSFAAHHWNRCIDIMMSFCVNGRQLIYDVSIMSRWCSHLSINDIVRLTVSEDPDRSIVCLTRTMMYDVITIFVVSYSSTR